jgi:hypothetical protein
LKARPLLRIRYGSFSVFQFLFSTSTFRVPHFCLFSFSLFQLFSIYPRVGIFLLLPGTILLIITGLLGLKAAHRRINLRRVLIIILVAVAISCVIWLVLNHASQPPSPDE